MNAHSIVFSAALFCAASANAAEVVWTGAENNLYTNENNWASGKVPSDKDYDDFAIFTENDPANKTPTMTGSRSVQELHFRESTGWTLDGTTAMSVSVRSIQSSGVGTNMFNVSIKKRYTDAWQISQGNTVVLSEINIDNEKQLALRGGGTAVSKKEVVGWPPDKTIFIHDVLLRIESASLFSSNAGFINIAHPEARLQYKATPAQAKARFGATIINTYGRGCTLIARDIGDGYVEVSLAEPTTFLIVK